MAELELIDEIVDEIMKARAVNLPRICVKTLFLSYWMYCVNSYDVKYNDRQLNKVMRLNSGCLILCEKGTGKSLTVSLLRDLFSTVENERKKRFQEAKEIKIGIYERAAIPSNEGKKKIDEFYASHGRNCVSVYRNVSTSKSLCSTYAQAKRYNVNNLLFNVDEIGGVLEDVFSKNPSISGKEFYKSLNELFDGFCSMGESMTAKGESIESQTNVGANFIFTSTAEFLKDYHVQKKYQQSIEAGLARRLLFINCPPIDLWNADMNFYDFNILKFKPEIDEVLTKIPRGVCLTYDDDLKNILATTAAKKGVIIFDEYLILLFCAALAIWTKDTVIKVKHWDYMLNMFKDVKDGSLEVVSDTTTSYDKICAFMREYLESKSRKKMPIVIVKDFCIRNKMCFDSKFKRWFDGLCIEFASSNTSKYIIESNQTHLWLSDNYAFEEAK